MFYYILFGSTAYFICCSWKNILWLMFYYYAYIECVVKSHLCIKNETKNNDEIIYLGILKDNKNVEQYKFSKNQDYLFYYCENYQSSCLKTNYKFITITLNILYEGNKDTHTICLQDEKKTFYLENNMVLSKEFITWYCLSYKHINLPKNSTYKIILIDNMANIQTIIEDQYIKLNKDFYEIKNIS